MSKEGTVLGRKKNMVEEDAWRTEAIKKENKSLSIYENFTVNPKRLGTISEKITAKKPVDNYEEVKKELGDAYATTIKKVVQVPKEKYTYPLTTSQEFGWDAGAIKVGKKFSHPRSQCNETKYAANYISMSHTSPFADQHKAKKLQ